jgi:hypothetical protein
MTQEESLAAARELDKLALAGIVEEFRLLKWAGVRTRVEKLSCALILAQAEEDATMKDWREGKAASLKQHHQADCLRRKIQWRLLPAARRDAIKDFALKHDWKYEGDLGVAELHTESLSRTWCETCGGLCRANLKWPGYLTDGHRSGYHTAFRARRDYCGRTEAVVQHTRHPFEGCEVFAAAFNLKVVRLDWSWYGLPVAALFVRAADARKFGL